MGTCWVVTAVILGFISVGICDIGNSRGNYYGYHVLRVHAKSAEELEILKGLHETDGVEAWVLPRAFPTNATLVVDGNQANDVANTLDYNHMAYMTLSQDLQSVIEDEKVSMLTRTRGITGVYDFNNFNSHDQINFYLREVCKRIPACELYYVGTSYEGRSLLAVKFGRYRRNKPAIWIDAGIHAREWLAPATAMFIIHKFEQGIKTQNPEIMEMIDRHDWFILPSMNPDGYEYSRSVDRFWRKTRSLHRGQDPECVGVDANRNWGFHWMEIGADSNPCSDIYGGPKPFSEPETIAVRDFLNVYKDRLEAYITLHSYGQFLLFPWGYTSDLPHDGDDLLNVAMRASEAIKEVDSKQFTVGSSTNVLYAAAGGSDDWAKGVAGIKYSYTVELRDSGWHGFVVPADEIDDSGEEMWAGIKEMQNAILEQSSRK